MINFIQLIKINFPLIIIVITTSVSNKTIEKLKTKNLVIFNKLFDFNDLKKFVM